MRHTSHTAPSICTMNNELQAKKKGERATRGSIVTKGECSLTASTTLRLGDARRMHIALLWIWTGSIGCQ